MMDTDQALREARRKAADYASLEAAARDLPDLERRAKGETIQRQAEIAARRLADELEAGLVEFRSEKAAADRELDSALVGLVSLVMRRRRLAREADRLYTVSVQRAGQTWRSDHPLDDAGGYPPGMVRGDMESQGQQSLIDAGFANAVLMTFAAPDSEIGAFLANAVAELTGDRLS